MCIRDRDDNGKELRTIKTVKIVNPKDQRVTTDNPGTSTEAVEVIYDDGSSYKINVDVLVCLLYTSYQG